MAAQCKNHTKPGGAETVIGGKLTILPGGQTEGFPEFPVAAYQGDAAQT